MIGGWRRAAELSGIDRRTLALQRVVLASVVLVDLARRLCGELTAFHTDAGVLPRAALIPAEAAWRLDLFLLGGGTAFAAALLAVAIAASLALWIGWRARLATVVLFVLVASAQNRNPLALTPLDGLVAGLLFWSALLPLGSRWSLDLATSPAAPPESRRYVSWACAGLVLHLLLFQGAAARSADAATLALATAFLALLGAGWLWDPLARRLDRGTRVRIFYDGGCGFCEKCCRLLATFLVLPRAEIRPAQDSPRAATLMQRNDSWVVIDDEDIAHVKWAAFVALARQSPLLRPVAGVLRWRIWERPGDALYACVARHRTALGRWLGGALRARTVAFDPGRGARVLAAAALALVIAVNLAALAPRAPTSGGAAEALLERPARLLQLSPQLRERATDPAGTWPVFAGRLQDGSEVDVLRPDHALTWDPARLAPPSDDGARWRAYRARLRESQFTAQRPHYGRYLCDAWNRRAPADRRLLSVDLTWIEAMGVPATPRLERNVLWRQPCGAAP